MGGNSFIPASNKKDMGSSTYTYKQIFVEWLFCWIGKHAKT